MRGTWSRRRNDGTEVGGRLEGAPPARGGLRATAAARRRVVTWRAGGWGHRVALAAPTVRRTAVPTGYPRSTMVLSVLLGSRSWWSCCSLPALFYGKLRRPVRGHHDHPYVADFDVAGDGDLAVTETLTVDFPGYGKHGIFRFFDKQDPSAPTPGGSRTTSRSPGTAARAVRAAARGQGPLRNAKIGVAARPPTGAHTYVITLHHRRRPREGTDGRRPVLLEPDPRWLAAADRRSRT